MALGRVMMQDSTTKQMAAVDFTNYGGAPLVDSTWIDWGTGTDQISGADVPLADTGGFFSTDDVESALAETGGKKFCERKFIVNGISVTAASTTAAITNANQVPTEVIRDQSGTAAGVLLGATRIGVGSLSTPTSGDDITLSRHELMLVVDANGDVVMDGTGHQVYAIYESKRSAGQTIFNASGDAQIIFIIQTSGSATGYEAVGFPNPPGTGTYYTWPVVRSAFTSLNEDALLYGGGGAEDIDNTPYSAGSGINISGSYVISLGALTGDWDAGGYEIRALTFESDVTTGTAPFTVASTTAVTNLNADLLDGNHAAAFATASHVHSASDITSGTLGVVRGGTGLSACTTGDLLLGSGTNTLSVLNIGTNGYVLTSNGTTASWQPGGAPAAHLLGGASHTADTLANLNSKVSDDDVVGLAAVQTLTGTKTWDGANVKINDTDQLILGDSSDDTITHDATDTRWTHVGPAGSDLIFDNTNTTGSIIFGLGTDTSATDFHIESDNGSPLFTVQGDAVILFACRDNYAAAFLVENIGGDDYIKIDTTTGAEIITFGNATDNPDYSFLGSGTFSQGSGGGQVTFTGNVNATNGLDVTTADLTVGGANFAVGVDGIVDAGTWQATSIKTGYGGTGLTSYTAGDMLYYASGTSLSKLAIGTAYQTLRVNSGATAPEWTSEGQTVTTSLVAVGAGVTAKRLVAAHNDAGTGKLEEASAATASTAYQVAGVALATAGSGAAVKLQTTGVVTCTLPGTHAAITAGDTAYLAQAAGGYVVMYTNIAYTSTAYIVPVGIFLQTIAANTGGDVLVALGAVGMGAQLVP